MTEDVQDNDLFPIPATDAEGKEVFIGKKQLMINKVGRYHQYKFEFKGDGGEVPDALKGAFTLLDFAQAHVRSYLAKIEAEEIKPKVPVSDEPKTKREARREGYAEKKA